jgi:hypothetical protein
MTPEFQGFPKHLAGQFGTFPPSAQSETSEPGSLCALCELGGEIFGRYLGWTASAWVDLRSNRSFNIKPPRPETEGAQGLHLRSRILLLLRLRLAGPAGLPLRALLGHARHCSPLLSHENGVWWESPAPTTPLRSGVGAFRRWRHRRWLRGNWRPRSPEQQLITPPLP